MKQFIRDKDTPSPFTFSERKPKKHRLHTIFIVKTKNVGHSQCRDAACSVKTHHAVSFRAEQSEAKNLGNTAQPNTASTVIQSEAKNLGNTAQP